MAGQVVGAGQLRQRVELQQPSETQQASGELALVFTTVASRWASIEPLSGRELWLAQQAQVQVTHRVTVRYYAGLTAKWRVKFGTRTFQVDAVLVSEEIKTLQVLMCVEQP